MIAVFNTLGFTNGASWQSQLGSIIIVGVYTLVVFIIMITLFRIVSLASVSAALSLPLIMFLSFKTSSISLPFLLISLLAMTLVIWRHRENIVRLMKGKEPRIGES